MKIVVNAGHGPDTPGKRCPDNSMREFHFNAATADFVHGLLVEYEGVEVMLTHAEARDVPLEERTDRANAWPADLYLSIHANAYGDDWNAAQGIETFVYTTRPAAAVALANAVQRKLIAATGRPDRGVKSANFHELRETHMASILIECGFMTNKLEAELLKSDTYRQKCALAIVAGVVETYGMKRKVEQVPPLIVHDVPEPLTDDVSDFAREARDWAVAAGITDGSKPRDPVTREEVWTMLYRALK